MDNRVGRTAVLALIVVMCPVAAFSAVTYTAAPVDGTEAFYSHGKAAIISDKPGSLVVLAPSVGPDEKGRPLFTVIIANKGAASFDVGPQTLTVLTDRGKPVAVLTAEQLDAEARSKARRLDFAARLNAAGAALSGTETRSGQISGPSGTSTFTFSSSNAAAGAQNQAAAQAQIVRTRAEIDTLLARAQYNAFQRQTVVGHGDYGSLITLARIPSGTKRIDVTFIAGAEKHRFGWTLSGR